MTHDDEPQTIREIARQAAQDEVQCPHCKRWTWHSGWCIHCFALLTGKR